MLDDGGYSAGSRVRFGVLALLAAALAAAADPQRARRIARAPVLAVLLALAILGAVSALWTVGLPADALRWGVVTLGAAAVAFAAGVLVSGARPAALAGGLVGVLAVAMGIVGLVAAARTQVPLAHRQAGLWRPGATFQYSPALALLMVSALPALLSGMCRARTSWQALLAGFGGAVAGATLALTESRTQLGFAAVVCAVGIALAPRALRVSRGTAAAAVALVLAAGLGTYAVAGGYIPLTPRPDGGERLRAIAAVVAAGAAAWALCRVALRRAVPAVALTSVLLAAGIAAAAVKPAPLLMSSGIVRPGQAHTRVLPPSGAQPAVRDRLLHGRPAIWRAALETFADRPLSGGGADSYLVASAPHQGPVSVSYAHELPLELGAELGVAGLLLALALYATAGHALWQGRRGPAAWLLGPAAAAFLAANLIDWPWHLAGSVAVWALALGGMLGTRAATRGGY